MNTINLNGKEWYFAKEHTEIEKSNVELDQWNKENRQKIAESLVKSVKQIKNREYKTANDTYQKIKDISNLSMCYGSEKVNLYLFILHNNQGLCYMGMNKIENAYESFLYATIYEIFHLRANDQSDHNYELMLNTDYCKKYMIGAKNFCTAYEVIFGANLSPIEIVKYINYCANDNLFSSTFFIPKLIGEFKPDADPRLDVKSKILEYEQKLI